MSPRRRRIYTFPRPAPSPARVEAEALFRLVQTGREPLTSVRKLIAIPGDLQVQAGIIEPLDPSDRKKLLDTLKFRKQVLDEFEKLVSAGQPNH